MISPDHLAILAASGITPEHAAVRGYETITDTSRLATLKIAQAGRNVPVPSRSSCSGPGEGTFGATMGVLASSATSRSVCTPLVGMISNKSSRPATEKDQRLCGLTMLPCSEERAVNAPSCA